jgi:Type VI secretion system VasI, EvfG, VC_A0118
VESIAPNQPSRDQSESEALQSELDALVARTGTAANAITARPDAGRLTLMLVGAAGIIAGVALVSVLSWLRGDAPLQTAAAAPATTAPATKPVASIVESATAPTWTGQRKATWANDGSKTIAFELQAMHDVPVWMSKARPVLVVQCLSRATQSFVILGASANFEEDTFRRTVRVQWDEGPTMTQQWQASQSGQELFAPDGIAFARQLTKARHLRIGFTPYNAPPVTADFAVRGFDELAGLVASTCGWRLNSAQ